MFRATSSVLSSEQPSAMPFFFENGGIRISFQITDHGNQKLGQYAESKQWILIGTCIHDKNLRTNAIIWNIILHIFKILKNCNNTGQVDSQIKINTRAPEVLAKLLFSRQELILQSTLKSLILEWIAKHRGENTLMCLCFPPQNKQLQPFFLCFFMVFAI